MNKGELRARMRQARRALSEAAQQEAAQAAAARILSLEAYRQARVVMAYMAVRGELALDAVLRDALETGKTLALPDARGKRDARVSGGAAFRPAQGRIRHLGAGRNLSAD